MSLVSKTFLAIKYQEMKQYLWNAGNLMNMSKYTILPNSELILSKMAKLQGLEKYLLWCHTDVIEAFNFGNI